MKKILNLGVFTIAILITTIVSLGCNFWFFYSLFGGQGNEAIAAGLSGCAIQLFGYAFSMYLANAKWYFKPLVACVALMPLALTMFTTFTTIYGFVASESVKQQQIAKRDEFIFSSLEQSKASQKLLMETAEQGLSVRARSQVERLIKSSNEAKAIDAELIKQVATSGTETKKKSPLDGLLMVAGNKELTLKIFCMWLAALFDILPVIAFMLLGNESRQKVIKIIDPPQVNEVKPVKQETAANEVIEMPQNRIEVETDQNTQEDAVTVTTKNVFPFIQKVIATQIESEVISEPEVGPVKVDYDSIILAILEKKIQPSYKEVQSFANISQWEAQKFFKWAVTTGKISRMKSNKFEICI